MRKLQIRHKQIAILALPVLALSILAAARIQSNISSSAQAARLKRAITYEASVMDLVQELQLERDLAAVFIGSGKQQGRPELTAQQERTDQVLDEYRSQTTRLEPEGYGQALRTAVQDAGERLENLPRQRQAVAPSLPRTLHDLNGYTEMVDDLFTVGEQVAREGDDPQLSRDVAAVMALARSKESLSSQRGLLGAALATGRFRPGEHQQLASLIGAEGTWFSQFNATAPRAQRDLATDTVLGTEVQRVNTLRASALSRPEGQALGIDQASWWNAATTKLDLMRKVERDLLAEVTRVSGASASSASTAAITGSLLIGLVVALSGGLSLLMARSMVRSLRALKDAANEVAERRLPRAVERLQRLGPEDSLDTEATAIPIPVRSGDEVQDVAEAFNSVHRVAVQVAGEQAALRRGLGDVFLNLARRSKALIDRQLKLMDDLERDEEDPDRLADLFKLDHLATRMRRLAEDLIVLSGAKPTRRWSYPVPLLDVVRAAAAEVEDYTRVEVLVDEDRALVGLVVADVVHLLAELIENATQFSPADTQVCVAGQEAADGYVLEIEDKGVGMSDAELLQANERLTRPPAASLALRERLGLYVVGQLASRYGIRVQLRHSWYGGITALALIPQDLLVAPPQDAPDLPPPGPPVPVPARPGHRPERRALAAPPPDRSGRDGIDGKPHMPTRPQGPRIQRGTVVPRDPGTPAPARPDDHVHALGTGEPQPSPSGREPGGRPGAAADDPWPTHAEAGKRDRGLEGDWW
jgi:HAMP domain-containing protein